MKKGLLTGVIIAFIGIVFLVYNNRTILFNKAVDYTKLSKANKHKVIFTFKIRQSGSTPADPYYAINTTIKNNSKYKVKINLEDFKIIGDRPKYNPKPTKNRTLTINPNHKVEITNLFNKISGQAILGGNLIAYKDSSNILACPDVTKSYTVKSSDLASVSKSQISSILENEKANTNNSISKASSADDDTSDAYAKTVLNSFVKVYKKQGYLNVYKIKLTVLKNDDNDSYIFKDQQNGARMNIIREDQDGKYMYHPMVVNNPDSIIELQPLNVSLFESKYNAVKSIFSVTYKDNKKQ
ncbi:hypothetical protein DW673_09855 [Lactiplantibacillus plantarum]|uniref:hypothetical protein n=1 Tax=Lactiplantibacillus plantarum TaxID=1590 RepID=UPI000C9EEF54|nr:hypothetical protein [Lactiplantibacillus plantarum]AUS72286.1 hypothetical protein C1T23_01594 [Lactiplantibacillus plantarum]MBO2714293.1 hypothetical protein [Lactiplantibacillus plantarum]PTM29435.1 hypothetical protein DA799_13200 [Lactiplantibacillus plantarum]RHF54218.1 hypothetical protein DW673_09855 [Lactiplantibacillus plantarum]USZ12020.1 hypothetical protein NHN79_13355 [Lactiplantibacillus plantarum]